jgi:pimeloyl-ACP methyl ester carboxylesterase
MRKTIYCFSGLGADERLFSKLSLEPFYLKHIAWLPFKPGETLSQYAFRLSQQIKEERPLLMGVSFGGMLAIEAAKHFKNPYTIIISSVQSAIQLPLYYQWAHKVGFTKAIPAAAFTTPNALMHYLFGTEGKEEKELLNTYLKKADPAYIKWALEAIMNWRNNTLPQNVLHLHGTNDKIIPLPATVNYPIEKGGHLMIYNRAAEISSLLQKILAVQSL